MRTQGDAQANQRDEQQRARKDEEGTRGADAGHDDEDGEEGADDTASGGDGVEEASVAPRFSHLLHAQTNGERRDAAKQKHGQGKEQHNRDQRTVQDVGGERGEGEQRPVEDGRRDDRYECGEKRGGEREREKQRETRITIGEQSTNVVADAQIEKNEPDQAGPHKKRAAEVGREQTRSGHLDSERGGTRDKDEQQQQPVLQSATGSRSIIADAGPRPLRA